MTQPSSGDRRLPSPVAFTFAAVLLAIVVVAGRSIVNTDGELARHLAHARHMVAAGRIMQDYPFSFTTPGWHYVAIEYASQLAFYAVYALGGIAAVACFAAGLIAGAHALQMRLMLRRDVAPSLGLVAVALGAWMGVMFWQVRPQMFSLVLIMLLLDRLEQWRPWRWWGTLLVFAVWANFHPAWLYGLILIGVYAAGAVAESFLDGENAAEWRARARNVALMLVPAALGTLLTPHGIWLHRQVRAFFALRYQIDNIGEFVSPNFHDPAFRPLLVGIIAIIGALALSKRRLRAPHLLVVVTHVAQSLEYNRYASLLGIVGTTVVAIHVAPEWDALLARFASLRAADARWRTARGPIAWIGAAVVLVALSLAHGRVLGRQLVSDAFSPYRFPIEVIERARRTQPAGRLYTETISWSGYSIFAWPQERIFMDGSGDFFGDDLLRESHSIRSGRLGFDTLLTRRGVDLVIASPRGALAQALASRTDWRILDCDQAGVLFGRLGDPAVVSDRGGRTTQCVPGVRPPAPTSSVATGPTRTANRQ